MICEKIKTYHNSNYRTIKINNRADIKHTLKQTENLVPLL